MSLRERLTLTTVATVGVTAALVGTAGHLAGGDTGVVAAEAVAAGIAFAASAFLARLMVLRPLEEQVGELVGWIRRPEKDAKFDPELEHVSHALRMRMHELKLELERLSREAKIAEEGLDTSPFGIAIVDEEGRISYASPMFRGMFRLRAEPVGRLPIEVVPVVEIHEAVEAVKSGGAVFEKACVTPSLDLMVRAHPISGGRVILRIEDVTRDKEAERSRTDFVANVSHELRTPVAAIMGYLEALMEDADKLPPEMVPLIETVERNARRLRDLFEDLLRLHRIEVRRRELPLERHRLRPILAEAIGSVIDKAKMRQQEFELDCPDDLVAWINPEALSAIVSNLAGNASAYTTEGGHVQVRAIGGPKGAQRIEVTDDGIGIAEKHHERIFERFFRVDEARSRRVGGTGLGLAIVKHYALASRCTVTLRSKEGQGSTFIVHLPEP